MCSRIDSEYRFGLQLLVDSSMNYPTTYILNIHLVCVRQIVQDFHVHSIYRLYEILTYTQEPTAQPTKHTAELTVYCLFYYVLLITTPHKTTALVTALLL